MRRTPPPYPPPYTRRDFVWLLAGSAASLLGGGGCSGSPTGTDPGGGPARLATKWGPPSGSITPGLWRLGLAAGRDGFLYVPASYRAGRATPLVVGLHGGGAHASDHINFMSPYADAYGFLLLAPDSRGPTWDGLDGGFGPDVPYIDAALQQTFDRCSVDAGRVVVEGFSDGASYALGLGLANGDLLRRVVAFSPGSIPPSDTPAHGKPTFFFSHGRQDVIIPPDGASRIFVPALRRAGYQVTYDEFDGGHEVPPAVATTAVTWMLR